MIIHVPEIFPKDKITAGLVHGVNSPSFTGKSLDDATKQANRQLLADHLNINMSNLLFQRQVHGDTIRIITPDYTESESDALISDIPSTIINASIADCLAILLFDPTKSVVSAVHSGWKGTQLNIAGKAIAKMQDSFNTNPENLLVYLSPCASEANYEVGEEFSAIFPNFTKRYPDGKLHFDNRSAVLDQLTDAGIMTTNIENHDECTIANTKYHSYRRDKELSGRMTTFIGLK